MSTFRLNIDQSRGGFEMGAVKWMKNMGNGALAGNLLSFSCHTAE